MKKLIFALILIFLPASFLFAQDRVKVQVQFRKALWACPGGDEITDLNVGTPSVYEHNCKDGTWLNSFKEYNGILTYTPEEFEKADSKEKELAKTEAVDKWVYEIKHPAPYVEPSKDDYFKMYQSRIAEAQENLDKYSTLATAEELQAVKADLSAKVDSVQTSIEAKPIEEKPIEEKIVK